MNSEQNKSCEFKTARRAGSFIMPYALGRTVSPAFACGMGDVMEKQWSDKANCFMYYSESLRNWVTVPGSNDYPNGCPFCCHRTMRHVKGIGLTCLNCDNIIEEGGKGGAS